MKVFSDIIGKADSNLISLSLNDCSFNHLGALLLYRGLKKNGKLKQLVLDKNDLFGRSLYDLASTLVTNGFLQKLSLENCNL